MKIRFAFAVIAALSMCAVMAAQSSASQGSSSQATSPSQQRPSASGDQNAEQSQTDKSKDEKKKDKKDKKDKKKKNQESDSEATASSAAEVFSTATADDVLKTLADGLEGHSQRLMLSAFDTSSMDGGLQFEDQIEAFFRKYEAFRVHFRIANASQAGDKGIVLVDIELEELPRAGGNPVRKNDQMRFELERGRKGWKIVDFRPRGFFS